MAYQTPEKNVELSETKMPMYITIGPPCSGKTSFLKKKIQKDTEKSDLHDVAIDDQEGVYLSILTSYFLVKSNERNKIDSLNQTKVFGKTLAERIYSPDNDEMRWVLQQLHNNNSYKLEEIPSSVNNKDIEDKWRLLQEQHNVDKNNTYGKLQNSTWADVYVHIVKEFINSNNDTTKITLPKCVDLFIFDAIFKSETSSTNNEPRSTDNEGQRLGQSGLDAAKKSLEKHAYSQPQHSIAWGNTNTKESDYKVALEIAQKTQRPVHFVVYYNNDNHSTKMEPSFSISKVSIEELFRRNIRRMLQTGRYIPCRAIIDAILRVETLVCKAEEELLQSQNNQRQHRPHLYSNESNDSPLLLDHALAQMAGYQLHPFKRTVKKISCVERKGVGKSFRNCCFNMKKKKRNH